MRAAQLHDQLPESTITGLDAGLNICLRLEGDVDDHALAEELSARGIRCAALSDYRQRSETTGGLVIDLTAANPQAIVAITTAIRNAPTSSN
ncbi:MAG: hypothetical protein WAK18_06820 [Nocardioidaceae bacterium]